MRGPYRPRNSEPPCEEGGQGGYYRNLYDLHRRVRSISLRHWSFQEQSVGDGGIEQVQELQLLFSGQKRRLERIAGELTPVFVGEAEVLLRYLVFPRQGCAEHSGIVGVERDHEAVVKILFYRMLCDRLAAACAQVAGNADFDGNLALGQLFQQIRILRCGQAVADAFGAEIDRSPDRFRASGLSGVRGETQTVVG